MSGGPGPAIQPYRAEICSNAQPYLSIGVDPNPAPRRVLANGELRTWSIVPITIGVDAGKYSFGLDEQWASADRDQVVTVPEGVIPVWDVKWSENEPASFSILEGNMAWTMTSVPGGTWVMLQPFTGEVNQLFSLSFKE